MQADAGCANRSAASAFTLTRGAAIGASAWLNPVSLRGCRTLVVGKITKKSCGGSTCCGAAGAHVIAGDKAGAICAGSCC